MQITVRRVTEDLEKIVPALKDLKPFQFLKEMASTRAIGLQGITVDGLWKDYEQYILDELDKNSPSDLDIDPSGVEYPLTAPKIVQMIEHPVSAPDPNVTTTLTVAPPVAELVPPTKPSMVDALRKSLAEKTK